MLRYFYWRHVDGINYARLSRITQRTICFSVKCRSWLIFRNENSRMCLEEGSEICQDGNKFRKRGMNVLKLEMYVSYFFRSHEYNLNVSNKFEFASGKFAVIKISVRLSSERLVCCFFFSNELRSSIAVFEIFFSPNFHLTSRASSTKWLMLVSERT